MILDGAAVAAGSPSSSASAHQLLAAAQAPQAVLGAPDLACDEDLSTAAALDRSHLYDLAGLLLSELVPGWDEVGDEDDDDNMDEYEHDDDVGMTDVEVDHLGDLDDGLLVGDAATGGAVDARFAALLDPAVVDPVVDASYRTCMWEAERFLVQCEGFDPDGVVVTGLRQHLHLARVRAALAVACGGMPELAASPAASPLVSPGSRSRRRPGGYP